MNSISRVNVLWGTNLDFAVIQNKVGRNSFHTRRYVDLYVFSSQYCVKPHFGLTLSGAVQWKAIIFVQLSCMKSYSTYYFYCTLL